MIGTLLCIYGLIFIVILTLGWAVGAIAGTIYRLMQRAISRYRYGRPTQIDPVPRR